MTEVRPKFTILRNDGASSPATAPAASRPASPAPSNVIMARPAPPIELPETVYQLIREGNPQAATQRLAKLMGTTEVAAEQRIDRWWRQQTARDR